MKFDALPGSPVVTTNIVEAALRALYESGRPSIHSLDGTLLAPMLCRLVETGTAFTLQHVPRSGYMLELGNRLAEQQPRVFVIDARDLTGMNEITVTLPEQPMPEQRDPLQNQVEMDALYAASVDKVDADELVGWLADHLIETKDTLNDPQFVRLTATQQTRLVAYIHEGSLCGLPVVVIGSQADYDRMLGGENGVRLDELRPVDWMRDEGRFERED